MPYIKFLSLPKKKKKKDEYRTCLSVLLSYSVVKTDNYYYPQIFLQECKYAIKKKKKINATNE